MSSSSSSNSGPVRRKATIDADDLGVIYVNGLYSGGFGGFLGIWDTGRR